MGTRFEIVLPDSPRGPSGARLRAAGEAAIDEIETWHRRLNRFAPDSLVSHLNRGLTSPLPLDRDTFDLFDDALAVWRDSWGAAAASREKGRLEAEAPRRSGPSIRLRLQ